MRADLGRAHAPAVHDDLALDVAPVRAHPRDSALLAVLAAGAVSIASTRVRVAIRTPPARAPAASA